MCPEEFPSFPVNPFLVWLLKNSLEWLELRLWGRSSSVLSTAVAMRKPSWRSCKIMCWPSLTGKYIGAVVSGDRQGLPFLVSRFRWGIGDQSQMFQACCSSSEYMEFWADPKKALRSYKYWGLQRTGTAFFLIRQIPWFPCLVFLKLEWI